MEIEKAIEHLKKLKYDITYYPGHDDCLNIAISALERQLTGSWISVSERLPKDRGSEYLATLHFNFTNLRYNETYCCMYDNGWYYNGANVSNRVKAWQPLPEPYKDANDD